MRVLVTGGAGFIGSQVVRALIEAGHEPAVLDLQPSPPGGLPGVAWHRGDVRDQDTVARAVRGVDAVSHQAAKVGLGVNLDDGPDYTAVNDHGCAVVLAAMARAEVARLVLASSMVVYGEGRYTCASHGVVPAAPRRRADLDAGRFDPTCPTCGRPLEAGFVTEDACPDPRNIYASTKLTQEHLAAVFARETGAAVSALRYHNVYGPGMPRDTPYAGVAAIFRSELARGRRPRVFEDGAQRRDFVHVRDVAAANLAALDHPTAPGTARAYNVGSGTPRTVGELAAALAETCAGPEPVVTGEYRLGDVRHITASSDRCRAELDWTPRVDFADGMAEFAAEPSTPPSGG